MTARDVGPLLVLSDALVPCCHPALHRSGVVGHAPVLVCNDCGAMFADVLIPYVDHQPTADPLAVIPQEGPK